MRRGDAAVRIHLWSLRLSVTVAMVGWIVMVVGFLGDAPRLVTVGGRMFVAFVAVWGLSNGGVLLWGIRVMGRAEGWKRSIRQSRQHPWSAGLYGLVTVFFLWVGWAVAAALVRQGLR